MLVRLMYCSRVAETTSPDALAAIVAKSRASNPTRGITGALCSCGKIFLQVIEGSRTEVNGLYNTIAADNRHGDVMLLSYEEIEERRFAHWAMGSVSLARINPSLLIKYSERAELNPYAVSGKVSMALFDEMIATAAVMGQSA